MKHVLLSIIIPTLNEEHYLPNLLQDLKRQQEKNFEVIVIDANSEDQTYTVAKKYTQHFPLKILESKKRNVAYQRNMGAAKAVGKYLVFIDADSGVYPTFTKKLAKAITERKELLFIPALNYDENTQKNRIIANLINSLIETSHALGKPFSAGSYIIIEKNLFHHIGGFNQEVFMSEDHNLITKAYKAGVKTRFLKDIKVVMSLRRFNKEGQIKVFSKYFVTVMYLLMKGDVKEKIFTYNMGGQEYVPTKRRSIRSERSEQQRKSVWYPN